MYFQLVSDLRKAVLLDDPTTDQFKKWELNSAAPLILSTYVFDIQNPHEILQGAKPILIERGPFVYRQYTQNYDLMFGESPEDYGVNSTHRTLFYRSYTWYEFAPELSVAHENTTIITINMPFVTIRSQYEQQNDQSTIWYLFTHEGYIVNGTMQGGYINATEYDYLFINRTVHQTLFGWFDPVIELLQNHYRGFIKNYASFNDSLKDDMTKQFYQQIYTGAEDTFPELRNYLMYHNQSYIATCPLPTPTDYCALGANVPGWANNSNGPPTPQSNGGPSHVSELRGNDGSVFPSPISESSILTTFFSPLLRSIDLEFKQASVYKDVPLLQFGFPSEMYHNSEEYPPNAAFFQNGPTGLLNMSIMQGGIPLYVSQARFQGADPSLAAAIEPQWLAPPSQAPGTYFEVEPESGVTFHVLTSSQVNLYLSPLPGMPDVPGWEYHSNPVWFKNMSSLYMPIFWASEEGGIDNHDAAIISDVLLIISLSKNIGFGAGISLTVISILYLFLSWRTWDLEKTKHLHAVRSLIATDGLGSNGGGNNSSLLDSSVLIMREEGPASARHHGKYDSNNTNSQPSSPARKNSNMQDVDISYPRREGGAAHPSHSPVPSAPSAFQRSPPHNREDDVDDADRDNLDPPSQNRRVEEIHYKLHNGGEDGDEGEPGLRRQAGGAMAEDARSPVEGRRPSESYQQKS